MTVLCIDEKWRGDGKPTPQDAPVFNEQCLVTDCRYYEQEIVTYGGISFLNAPGIYYRLSGYKHQYHASHFAIIPEQSADEMSEEKREAIINIETQAI